VLDANCSPSTAECLLLSAALSAGSPLPRVHPARPYRIL